MDLHQLRVFPSVFRNRSFSKASAGLRRTQRTVSEHIRTPGDEFGARLIERAAGVRMRRPCLLVSRARRTPLRPVERSRSTSGPVRVRTLADEQGAEEAR